MGQRVAREQIRQRVGIRGNEIDRAQFLRIWSKVNILDTLVPLLRGTLILTEGTGQQLQPQVESGAADSSDRLPKVCSEQAAQPFALLRLEVQLACEQLLQFIWRQRRSVLAEIVSVDAPDHRIMQFVPFYLISRDDRDQVVDIGGACDKHRQCFLAVIAQWSPPTGGRDPFPAADG